MIKLCCTLLVAFVGFAVGCDCIPVDFGQLMPPIPGATPTVGDVSSDNTLDPNTPALDSPAANAEPIRVRLANPNERDADCRITMELIGREVHFSLRRVLAATESLVIGPDRADIIRIEVTFLGESPIILDVQILRIGVDFRPGDIIDIVLTLPPDESEQEPPPPPTPTGACCYPDGTCEILTESDCAGSGGDYRGNDSFCDPNPCPQPTGACCFWDGYCEVMTEDDCSSSEGSYWGDGTTCDPNPCPQPSTGACCLGDAYCEIMTEADCLSSVGEYMGDDTVCDPNPCLPPLGACCLWDGTCYITDAFDCEYAGGVYQGDDTTCDPNPCMGACCFWDGYCEVMTEDDCNYSEGSYWGDGTTCDPNPCPPPPTGACCFDGGYCEVLSEAECVYSFGEYQGDFTTCDPNPCLPPLGACCLWDGFCYITDAFDCEYSGGVYQGDDTTCDPNPCMGACCLWNGICVETTADMCASEYEGEYQGGGTSCDPNPCPIPPGNDCDNPIVVQLPAELPYQRADATCARVDDYTDTCLFPYDEGEDFICRLDVSETVFVDITLDPVGTPGTGIALSDVCPPSTECIALSTDDKGWLHGIYGQTLEPGTYYLMVDTAKWAGCAGFGLQIEYPNP